MKTLPCFLTVVACVMSVSSARGDIVTNFNNFATGLTDFTLTDATDPSFEAFFASPGEVAFFNRAPLYFQSNRAFAVEGGLASASADITFTGLAASRVTIRGRDTNGETTGPNSVTEPPFTVLPQAVGSIEAFDPLGGSLGSFVFPDTAFVEHTFTGPIARLTITNAGPANSYALLGRFDASPVPEPGTALAGLAALLAMGLLARRRARQASR